MRVPSAHVGAHISVRVGMGGVMDASISAAQLRIDRAERVEEYLSLHEAVDGGDLLGQLRAVEAEELFTRDAVPRPFGDHHRRARVDLEQLWRAVGVDEHVEA